MTDPTDTSASGDAFEALKARADALELQLRDAELHAASRLREYELKNEAKRAGIVDLDGLRLIESKEMTGRKEDLSSPTDVIAKLRRDKPWLFGASSSSSVASTPAAVPTKRKLATEMTVDEWRAARSDLLRRR